jgi:hypothetical protein
VKNIAVVVVVHEVVVECTNHIQRIDLIVCYTLTWNCSELEAYPGPYTIMTIDLQTTDSRQTAPSYTPYKKPTPELASTYRPTHPGQLRVVLEKGKGDDGEDTYSSYLVAEQVR